MSNGRVSFETFAKHAMFNKKNPYVRIEGVHQNIKNRFVCPKCSGLTLTDTRKGDPIRKYQTCPICGWHGPKSQTLTLVEAMEKETIVKNGKRYLR